MEEFTSICALVDRIRTYDYKVIGLDGTNGARKTTIASALAIDLNLPLISLDDYLRKNKGSFIEHIKYEELSKDTHAEQRFIIEGVCLLEVLEKVEVLPDILVYVKRYQLGMWADERELCVSEEELEEFLRQERDLAARLSGTQAEDNGPSLFDDIVRYHSKYRPQDHAHMIFKWSER